MALAAIYTNLLLLMSSAFTVLCTDQISDKELEDIFLQFVKRPDEIKPQLKHDTEAECGSGKQCLPEHLCSSETSYSGTGCSYPKKCCFPDLKNVIRLVKTHYACGHRNIDGIAIQTETKDNETHFGEFPWMVAILRVEQVLDRSLDIFICGGSLIAPQVVMTAAHCVHGGSANMFKVRAGEWETKSKDEIYPEQDRQLLEIIVHENYNNKTLRNDIALLILSEAFDLAPNVNTVCLPPANTNFDLSRCYVTGWGKDQFHNGEYQTILKKIDLPIVPNEQCEMNLKSTPLTYYFELHKSFICAGGEPITGPCKGDGGSPLVCPIIGSSNRYFQAGIVSWGLGCGEEDIPGVYASVSYLRPWIDQQLAKKNVNPIFFTA